MFVRSWKCGVLVQSPIDEHVQVWLMFSNYLDVQWTRFLGSSDMGVHSKQVYYSVSFACYLTFSDNLKWVFYRRKWWIIGNGNM